LQILLEKVKFLEQTASSICSHSNIQGNILNDSVI